MPGQCGNVEPPCSPRMRNCGPSSLRHPKTQRSPRASRNHLPHSEILAMLRPMENDQRPSSSSPPEPRREEAIFHAALALQAEQRPAYLNQACGEDNQLRRRIELLLQSHAHAGELLEPGVPTGKDRTMVVPIPPSEKPGDIIGHYKIREKLGEGGCGVVYVA